MLTDSDLAVLLVQRTPHVGGVDPALEAHGIGLFEAPSHEGGPDATVTVLMEDEDDVENCLCISQLMIDLLKLQGGKRNVMSFKWT